MDQDRRHQEYPTKHFTAHAVHARAPLPSAGPILIAVFASTFAPFDETQLRVHITTATSAEPLPGKLTREGDLLQVFVDHPFTRAGAFEFDVSLWQGTTQLQKLKSTVTIGEFGERLAARLAHDVAGEYADEGLRSYAQRLLELGASHADVINELMSSPQARRRTVVDAYSAYLKRSPSASEADTMTRLVAEDNGHAKLATALLASKEYFQTQGNSSTAGFVSALVRDLTGDQRLLPQAGDWLDGLNNGTKSPDAVIAAAMSSLPARIREAATTFERIHHRRPGVSELGIHDSRAALWFQPQSPGEDAPRPDFTYQFFVNLEQAALFAGGQNVRQLMIDTVKQLRNGLGALSGLIPSSSGVASIAWNGQENGGLWRGENAVESALQAYTPLPLGTFFSFTLTEQALSDMVTFIWDVVLIDKKRLNSSGAPDPDGQIELDGFEVSLEDNRFRVSVHATYHATSVIAVGAKAHYDADFSLTKGVIVPHNAKSLTYDAGIDWPSALSAGAWFGIPVDFAWLAIDWVGIHDPSLPGFDLGNALANFFPKKVLIPQTHSKIEFRYTSVQVVPGEGITASGIDFPFALREPSATLGNDIEVYYPDPLAHPRYEVLPAPGPGLIKLRFTFFVALDDMLMPWNINWTTDGVKSNQSGQSVQVTWQFNQQNPSSRFVQVHVVDADGLVATAGLTIRYLARERVVPVADPSGSNRLPFRGSMPG